MNNISLTITIYYFIFYVFHINMSNFNIVIKVNIFINIYNYIYSIIFISKYSLQNRKIWKIINKYIGNFKSFDLIRIKKILFSNTKEIESNR